MDVFMYKLLGGQVLKKSYATISHYKCCFIEPGAAG